MWLKNLLSYVFNVELELTVIHCDNHSYIKLSENHVFHDKSKHIDMRYHYVGNIVQDDVLSVQLAELTANTVTKPLSKYEYFQRQAWYD